MLRVLPFDTRHRRATVLTFVLAVLLLIGWLVGSRQGALLADTKAIQLAVVAPLSGPRSAAGREMVQSVQLYLKRVNQQGGIHGQPLQLLTFDDRNDPETAGHLPQEIHQSAAVVVLGHLTSATALAAAPSYHRLQIPVITGTASADGLTDANPYYFRTTFTNSMQGSLLALYAHRALQFNTASIIYADDSAGRSLSTAFHQIFAHDATVKHVWKVDATADNLHEAVDAVIDTLETDPESGILFLAVDYVLAKEFLVAMRRRQLQIPLLGNDTFARETFPKQFASYPEEHTRPGYFLDGMHIAAIQILDSASADTQEFVRTYTQTYGVLPTYVGASFYDAAMVAVQAIQQAVVHTPAPNTHTARQQVREQLAAINSREVAVRGLQGPIYFAGTHDNIAPMRIGQFVGRQLISAPIQLNPVTNFALVDVEHEIQTGNILSLTGQSQTKYFWRQEVVYAGIDINKLSRVDQRDSSFTVDFYLWMRYSSNHDATAIEFPNGVANSVNANAPLFDPATPLRASTINGLYYRLYQIRGVFKGSYNFRDYPFDQQSLKIYFQNTRVPSDRLLYVIDTFGLRLSGTAHGGEGSDPYRSLELWKFQGIQYAQETLSSTSTRGNPRLFNSTLRIDYPGLSATMLLQRRFSIFLIKTLLPLALLVLVLYSTLYFSANLGKERLTVAIAALLSSAVLLTAVNAQLPDAGYTVAIEYGFYIFFSLCLFCILIGLVIERLRLAGHHTAEKYLNTFARLGYVIVVLGTVVAYAVLFGSRL